MVWFTVQASIPSANATNLGRQCARAVLVYAQGKVAEIAVLGVERLKLIYERPCLVSILAILKVDAL